MVSLPTPPQTPSDSEASLSDISEHEDYILEYDDFDCFRRIKVVTYSEKSTHRKKTKKHRLSELIPAPAIEDETDVEPWEKYEAYARDYIKRAAGRPRGDITYKINKIPGRSEYEFEIVERDADLGETDSKPSNAAAKTASDELPPSLSKHQSTQEDSSRRSTSENSQSPQGSTPSDTRAAPNADNRLPVTLLSPDMIKKLQSMGNDQVTSLIDAASSKCLPLDDLATIMTLNHPSVASRSDAELRHFLENRPKVELDKQTGQFNWTDRATGSALDALTGFSGDAKNPYEGLQAQSAQTESTLPQSQPSYRRNRVREAAKAQGRVPRHLPKPAVQDHSSSSSHARATITISDDSHRQHNRNKSDMKSQDAIKAAHKSDPRPRRPSVLTSDPKRSPTTPKPRERMEWQMFSGNPTKAKIGSPSRSMSTSPIPPRSTKLVGNTRPAGIRGNSSESGVR